MKYKLYDECHTIGYFKTIEECIKALLKWDPAVELRQLIDSIDITKDYNEIETDDDIYYIEMIG